MISFASDNNAGVHPRILSAIAKANKGAAPAYGDDTWTADAMAALRKEFGATAEIFFVFLGTAANVLGLSTILRRYDAVLCSPSAHINVDECGAPEALTGSKLISVAGVGDKLTVAACLPYLAQGEAVHHVRPKVISVTQSTEYGSVYSIAELKALGEFAKKNNMYFHMDGARLANAASALNCSLAAISLDVGVDVLSFGGTKNGLMFGEAVVIFNHGLAADFGYIRKQGMQLMSKMRFLSAQFIEYMNGKLWLENAKHANRMAALLSDGIQGYHHIQLTRPVLVNAVFARLSRQHIHALQRNFYFYIWDENDGEEYPSDWPEVRIMTSFDTKEEEVKAFIDAVRALA